MKKKIKLEQVSKVELMRDTISRYLSSTDFPTFSGFLVYANITSRTLRKLWELCYEEDQEALAVVDEIERFKMSLDAKMTEYLIYQEKHPELAGRRFYNYDNIKFLLKEQNKGVFSTGSVEANVISGGNNRNAHKLPENKSGVDLWRK